MHPLDWINHHRLESVTRREHDWSFIFDGHAYLTVECLWRLLENGRICVTSEDDGQPFGLPRPVVAADLLNQHLVGSEIKNVVLHEGTLDVELHFNVALILQILPTSAGYEGWNLGRQGQQFIAVGGGELIIMGRPVGG